MDNLMVEVDGDLVTVSAIEGHRKEFQEAASALVEAGSVQTVTGARGIALRVSKDVAEKAGVVKKAARKRTASKRTRATAKKNEKKENK